jgi:hypothetical protein
MCKHFSDRIGLDLPGIDTTRMQRPGWQRSRDRYDTAMALECPAIVAI